MSGPKVVRIVTREEIQAVCDHIQQLGFRSHALPGAQRTASMSETQ